MMRSPSSPWFLQIPSRCQPPTDRGPLICFPPAGAGAGFFNNWHNSLPQSQILPVQLPGRDGRFRDQPIEDANVIAEQVAMAIINAGWVSPTLLGYSFGALLAFETTRILESRALQPNHLIVCARSAPQIRPKQSIADLPQDSLLNHVRRLGGLPEIVEDEPEFLEILIPAMRADFRANDSFTTPKEIKIQTPVTVFTGRHDSSVSNSTILDWQKRTQAQCEFVEIDGGHFFVRDQPELFFNKLSSVV